MPTKNLIPAVSYVRMSSDKQEESPAQQRSALTKLAERHGCKLLREYYEPGISGDATEKRVEFQRMIRDAEEKGDFAAILCWDQDRFGRFDSIEAGRWIFPLRKSGVWLLTVAQGRVDWNDFQSRMMYSIVQEGKHQFLLDLSRNVLRGKIASAKKGKGANLPPYGYDRMFFDPSGKPARRVKYGERFTKPAGWSMRFVLSEDTEVLKRVRWMFDTFADTDCGMGWIASELNRKKIPTPGGKTWSVPTVQGILTNRVYTGANVFGRNQYGKYYRTGSNGEPTVANQANGERVPIVTADVHDRLIDDDTFERVQQKIAGRRCKRTKPRNNAYLLSGVLRCGHCGAPLAGKGCHGKDAHRYYICTTGNGRPGACHRYQMPQRAIEDYVLKVVHDRILAPDAIEQLKKGIYRKAKSSPRFKKDTKALAAKISALDQKIAKGNENLLLADPRDMNELSTLLRAWREDRAKLQESLEAAATTVEGKTAEQLATRAIAELGRLQKQLKTGDPMRVRSVIKAVVEEVSLWWEPHGKQTRFARGVIQLRAGIEPLSGVPRTTSQKLLSVAFTKADVFGPSPQDRALTALRAMASGQPIRASDIAKRAGMTPGLVNKALRRAAASGLVRSVWLRGWLVYSSKKSDPVVR